MRRRNVFASLLAVLVMHFAPASAETPPIVVGVYIPSVAFGDSMARARFAEALAAALASATGRPARGRAFVGGAEFFAQVDAGAVDFAVVDAGVMVERPGLKPIAQATSGGNPARPLAVVASAPSTLEAALGKALVLHEGLGREDRYVARFVLQGERGGEPFKRLKPVRDAQAALSQVRLGKADVTVTWASQAGELAVVATARPAPLPVWVQARPDVDPAVAASVSQAATRLALGVGPFDAFGPFNPGASALTALRSALSGAVAPAARVDPVLAPSPGGLPLPSEVVGAQPEPRPVALPLPADALSVPPPADDAL